MAAGSEEATFTINLGGNAADVAKTTSTAMKELKASIDAQKAPLEAMNAQLKALKASGATEAAKSLKGQIDAQKASIKGSSAELKKQSDAYRKSNEEAKKLKTVSADLKSTLDKTNKQYKELTEKRKKLADDQLKAKIKGDEESMAMLGSAALGAVAAIGALAVGLVSAAVAAARFIIRGADAARSIGLMREAAMGGNAQWGKNFGEQVDALALKVPTAKDKINELGKELAMSRIGGQVWVDTLNAVTQASAALGDTAGNKLKEFVERGRQFGRFQINPQEMIGTGVDFKDVAEALSKSMKIGVKEATAALFEGRVKLADGAKALRDAVEKKFGAINLRQMISLENITKKLGEAFDALTKNVDIEPILKGLKEMADIFSASTVSGQALKQIVEVFGKELSSSFTSTTPIAKKFIYGLIIGAQELVIAYLTVRNSLKKTFGDSDLLKNVDLLKVGLTAGKIAAIGIGVALAGVALTIGVAVVAFGAMSSVAIKAFTFIPKAIKGAVDYLMDVDWKATGTFVIDGLVNGLKLGASKLVDTVKGLAGSVKSTFTGVLGIQSPSKVFAKYGENTTEGYAQGVERSAPRAQSAVEGMAPSAPGGKGGKGGASGVVVNVTINASGGDAKQVAAEVSSASTLEQLTKAIIDALQGSGLPVPQ